MPLETDMYKVRLDNDEKKTSLYRGDFWSCERWVAKNGVVGETYVIVRLKKKEHKDVKAKKR